MFRKRDYVSHKVTISVPHIHSSQLRIKAYQKVTNKFHQLPNT